MPCSYVQTLLPLVACAISVIVLAYNGFLASRRSAPKGYEQLPTDDTPNSASATGPEQDGSNDHKVRADQQHSVDSTQTLVQLSKPRGMLFVVLAEAILSLAIMVLAIGMLATRTFGSGTTTLSISGIVCWSYITMLVALRLYATLTMRHEATSAFSTLWYHTTSLYFPLWICSIFIFRSQLLRTTKGELTLAFASTHFGLLTLLFLISICSRKGNRPIYLRSQPGTQPCQESTASILSQATFWWLVPLMRTAYGKTLEHEDIWDNEPNNKSANVVNKYAKIPRTGRLWFHIISTFKRDLIESFLWSTVHAISYFIPTLLLKVILEYLENPVGKSINTAWLAASLSVINGIVSAMTMSQGLWAGRRISIKLQALLFAEIYSKSLRRKVVGTKEKVLGDDRKSKVIKRASVIDEAETANDEEEQLTFDEPSLLGMWSFCFTLPRPSFWPFKKAGPQDDESPEAASDDDNDEGQASTGAVTSLMSSDISIIHNACAYLADVCIVAPLQLTLCVSFLFKLLGKSTFVTLASLLIFTFLQYNILKESVRLEKKLTSSKDARIHQTSEVITNVRIVKLFAWENKFLAAIDRVREVELKFLRRQNYVHLTAYLIFNAAPTIMAALTFSCYTLIEGKSLPPSVAFPALSVIFLLQGPLDVLADMINYIQMALVSINRIEEYLDEADSPKYTQLKTEKDQTTGDNKVGFENASFSWGSNGPDDFKLFDLNIRFVSGINVIFGPTGSGKTSLLSALLGEMKQVSGQVFLPGSTRFEDLNVDPATGLTESVAYCAQSPWLANNTVKQNILFASPQYDEVRYKQVLHACNLERDIEIWKKGDQTAIGDNGITISGGQKQRISLARALYSNSRYLLLDDVLSAVDSHTARWIVEEALLGPLVRDRTCVIVSHNTALVLPCATYSLVLDNGRVVAQGTPAEVITAARLSADESGSRPSTRVPSRISTPKPSQVNLTSIDQPVKSAVHAKSKVDEPTPMPTEIVVGAQLGGPGALTDTSVSADLDNAKATVSEEDLDEIGAEKETKATGAVHYSVIVKYLRAAGGPLFWFICFMSINLRFGVTTLQNAWVRVWANSYSLPRDEIAMSASSQLRLMQSSNTSLWAQSHLQTQWGASLNLYTLIPSNTLPEEGVQSSGYYIGIYALIGLAFIIVIAIEIITIVLGSLRASQRLHRKMMESLAYAKWRWYDTTPNGRITNRFTNDMTEVDEQASHILHAVLENVWNLITCLAVIAFLLPKFLYGAVFLVGMYVLVARFYINCSRDMKRISSVKKSPILQQFQETLSGVVTIRAYGHQHRFAIACQAKADDYLRPFLYNWASNRWLSTMGDMLSSIISFVTIVIVIANAGTLDPGSAGLAITYSLKFDVILNFLMRFYAMLEQNMNAVERVIEYSDIEREAEPIIEKSRAPANWPARGAIQFTDYSTKYAPQFDYALRDLTFEVPATAKVGVIGRTGAGKSSLALALFRALEADKGSIHIDGIDISKLGLHDLRDGVLMVPQDPTLFQGTLRSNLDPFNLFTDEEILDCLRKVYLIDSSEVAMQKANKATTNQSTSSPPSETGSSTTLAAPENKNRFYSLSTKVAEEGKNFSQGQRQLLCLARALLKSPKILLMDEATASIDYATDIKIQAALREFKHTFITIAHRLRTIIDYDKILVLDKGCLKEYGHPWELLQDENSQFTSMCEATGELESLRQEAKAAFEKRDHTLMD